MIATVYKFAPREHQAWVSNAAAYSERDWDAFKAYLEMRYCNICQKWVDHSEKDCLYACTDETRLDA